MITVADARNLDGRLRRIEEFLRGFGFDPNPAADPHVEQLKADLASTVSSYLSTGHRLTGAGVDGLRQQFAELSDSDFNDVLQSAQRG